MTTLKQNLITIGGALVVFIIFNISLTSLADFLFGPFYSGSGFGDIGPDIPGWVDVFLYTFPFLFTIIEFFFKKPFRKRIPYLIIIAIFILLGIADVIYSLQVLAIAVVAALPGSLYHWIKSRKERA